MTRSREAASHPIFSALTRGSAAAAVEVIYGSLAGNPQRVGKPLRQELAGLRSARRGDYRVIYRINTDEHQAEIVAIEHRAAAYRPR